MKTKLFRKTVQTWRATSLLLLLLATAPAFAQTPDLTVCAGQGFMITSKADAQSISGGVTYTWQVSVNNGSYTVVPDQTAASLPVPSGLSVAGTYAYVRYAASDACPGGVSTTPYTVVVHPLPKVAQSGASTFCDSGAHTLTVNASVDGDGVSVAWYTDAGLSGSTVSNTASCTVSASTVVGTYTYYVQATAKTTQCKAAATVTATRNLYEHDYSYTGAAQTFTAPQDGTYRLEVWGASGGTLSYTKMLSPGNGGYATGKYYLTQGQSIYIYVGGAGNGKTGGWNGGGAGTGDGNGTGTGGGGATDIRTGTPGSLTGSSATDSRIIVAGGGGGGMGSNNSNAGNAQGNPGHGGGLEGVTAGGLNSTSGNPGTQSVAGTGGSAGQGGKNTTNNWAGGGGGGWWGGGYGSITGWGGGGGGGGSAFIGGVIDGITYSGNQAMPDYSNACECVTMTGNAGHGFARITRICD